MPMKRKVNVVVLETREYKYELQESGPKPLVVPVNGEVQFYRDGDSVFIQDSKNKKHKFHLTGQTLLKQ